MGKERRIDRLDKYLQYKHLSDNKITVQLGLSIGTIGKSRKEGRDISDRVIEQILNYYTDLNKDYLLDPMDGHGDFLSWRSQLNKRLKAIGQQTGRKGKILGKGPFSEISTYWARHTWATLAYEVGISVDVIGQALGHSDRSHTVTFTYIKPDQGKVDEANRKVIDYITKKAPSM